MRGHVHVGAGKLGLGLIIDSCINCFDVRVFNRRSEKDQHANLVASRSYELWTDGISTRVDGVNLNFYDATNAELLYRAIADSSVVLLTTAVTYDGLTELAPFLAEGLKRRFDASQAPIMIIACENDIRSRDRLESLVGTLVPHCKPSLTFLDTMVDRVCELRSAGPPVQFTVESGSRWVIEDRSTASTLPELTTRPNVEFVKPERLKLERKRKLWGFNGMDVILALRAYEIGETFVRSGMDRLGIARAQGFGVLFSLALDAEPGARSIGFTYDENIHYVRHTLTRIKSLDSEAARVIREFIRDRSLSGWVKKVNQRVSHPIAAGCRAYADLMTMIPKPLTDPDIAVQTAGLLAEIVITFEDLIEE